MNAPASRRAGANLLAFLTAPSCRLAQRQICLRATQLRPISSSPRMRQQQSAPAPAPSPSSTPATTTPPAAPNAISTTQDPELRSLTEGFSDAAAPLDPSQTQVDWARSFHGLSSVPFTPEQAEILQQPVPYDDIEIKPDGIIYLPEIKYRRILNKSFGPGGWGLVPRGETIVTGKLVTREYGLVCGGRLVSTARGEQQYFDPSGIPTATEGCKSNALMRCCKDLGIASELWDPRFIKKFMAEMGREMIVEHQTTKKRRKHFMRRDDELKFPLKEVSAGASGGAGGGVKR